MLILNIAANGNPFDFSRPSYGSGTKTTRSTGYGLHYEGKATTIGAAGTDPGPEDEFIFYACMAGSLLMAILIIVKLLTN
jgi:hypothetical protein